MFIVAKRSPISATAEHLLGHRPSDGLINWNSGLSICPSTNFSDFSIIWSVGRPWPDMHTSVTSTRSKVKVKVTELLKFRKLHFCRSISSAIWHGAQNWWLIMTVGYVVLSEPNFFNFLDSKLSRDFKLRGMSILQDFQRAIFPHCSKLVVLY